MTSQHSSQPSHLQIFARAKWFIIAFTLLVGLAAFSWALIQPVAYKTVVAFDVKIVNRAQTPDYQYGSFYDIQAAELFSQHVMSWFQTPSFVEEIYQMADVPYAIQNVNRFTGRFKAEQYSAQNVVVVFSDYNRETAEKLANAVATQVETRAAGQVMNQDQSQFVVEAQNPVIVSSTLNPWLALGIALAAGFALSIVLVYVREYFREQQ